MLAGEGGGGCHEPHLSPPEPRTIGGRNMRFGDCFAGLLGKKKQDSDLVLRGSDVIWQILRI